MGQKGESTIARIIAAYTIAAVRDHSVRLVLSRVTIICASHAKMRRGFVTDTYVVFKEIEGKVLVVPSHSLQLLLQQGTLPIRLLNHVYRPR